MCLKYVILQQFEEDYALLYKIWFDNSFWFYYISVSFISFSLDITLLLQPTLESNFMHSPQL